MQHPPRLRITSKEFSKQAGISSTTLWRLSKKDKNFPTPIYILNKKLWYQDEVTNYIESLERTEPTHNNLDCAGAV